MNDLNSISEKLTKLDIYIENQVAINKDLIDMLQEKNQKINELENLKIELQRKIFELEHQLLNKEKNTIDKEIRQKLEEIAKLMADKIAIEMADKIYQDFVKSDYWKQVLNEKNND